MSDRRLRGVVVSHGDLASALVDATHRITGEEGALAAITNQDCSGDSLGDRITDALGGAPAVVFVDLPTGSCMQAAVRRLRGRSDVAVVAGVNLAMLLDFVYHRDLEPGPAAQRARDKGLAAIRLLES